MTKSERCERCEAIVRKMIDLANAGQNITLEADFGGDTATLYIGTTHTHVGIPEPDTFDTLVENLYNALHGRPGLSFYDSGNSNIGA